MRQNRWTLRLIVVVVLASAVFAAVHTGLIQEDFNIVRPSGAFTDTTLQTTITGVGSATKTLLIQPGTWTIGNNLTIPSNIHLHVAVGAQFNINGGRTLTINGSMDAPLLQIFSGAGRVVLGGRIVGVYPHWFGAACDGVATDTSAFSMAFTVARAGGQRVLLPDGANCRLTAAMDTKGVSIYGAGPKATRINVVGNGIRGLYYEPTANEDMAPVIDGISLIGSNCTSGGTSDLLTLKLTIQAIIRNSVFDCTAGRAIFLEDVIAPFIHNNHIRRFRDAGLEMRGTIGAANVWTVMNNEFENDGQPGTNGAIRCNPCGWGQIVANAFHGVSGLGNGTHGLVCDGCVQISVRHNFFEWFNASPIIARGIVSNNVSIEYNLIHCAAGCATKIDFSSGSLPHLDLVVRHNRFVSVGTGHILFHPGSAVSYEFGDANLDAAEVTNPEYVAGYPNTVRQVKKLPSGEALTYAGTLGLVAGAMGLDNTLSTSGSAFQISNAGASGYIELRVAGAERARVTANGLQLSGVSFGNLGGPANGTVAWCSDCTSPSSPCQGNGTGALAVRQNSSWKCL
jgi:hypothetical protein